MYYVITLIIGFVLGAGLFMIINHLRHKDSKKIAQELVSQVEDKRLQDLEIVINRMKESFGDLSFQALSKNTEEFLKLANETLSKQTNLGSRELEEKRKLIDKTLESMKSDLNKLQDCVVSFDKDRKEQYGKLDRELRNATEQTAKLRDTTAKLHTALASSKVRGQWGERMAEDVLRFAGFIEGINYHKQKTMESTGQRPDYTFLLPQGQKVNMDVKFPLDNYMHFLEADSETDKTMYKTQFLKDVKSRIKDVTTKDYINPADNTVDYVLVFIPNEQVYAFINENDPSVLDEALQNKVILCSPITLYAILAVIRQAIDNFSMEKKSADMLALFGTFHKEWDKFVKTLDAIGQSIARAQADYDKLTTTRRKKLEKPLEEIEQLRAEKYIPGTPAIEVDDDTE